MSDEIDVEELRESPCLHCRLTAVVQEWLDDPEGAARWCDGLVQDTPSMAGMLFGDLATQAAAVALAEVFSDLLTTQRDEGRDFTSMLRLFAEKMTQTGFVRSSYTPPPGEGSPSGGLH